MSTCLRYLYWDLTKVRKSFKNILLSAFYKSFLQMPVSFIYLFHTNYDVVIPLLSCKMHDYLSSFICCG